jgi:hypothetical protein
MLIKAFILQTKMQIADDTDFTKWLAKNSDCVDACGMPYAPSHDVISRFARKYGRKFCYLHRWLDEHLETMGVFADDDDLAGDGTCLPLHKPQSQKLIDKKCFGAKSDNEKFYGLWLMLIVSVKTGLIRAFNIGKAGEGQIKLMFTLLVSGMIKPGAKLFLDGIFDVEDIHAAAVFDQETLPMISYNRKRSRYMTRKDLPEEDWRGNYNPFFKDGLWFIIEFMKRSSVERTNSFLKLNTSLQLVYEKSRRMHKKSDAHIQKLVVGALISPQIDKLIEVFSPKPITLLDYLVSEEITA